LIAILLASSLVASPAEAASYYVDTSGDDSNPGTKSAPWEHCPGMIGWSGSATLSPGDIVYFDSVYSSQGSTITAHSNKNYYRAGGGTLVEYGNSTYAAGDITSWEPSALATDPGFTDENDLPDGFTGTHGVDMRPNAGGLEPASGSPAIEGGVDLGTPYATSINSVARDEPWDIGTYEQAPPSPPPAPPANLRIIE
jgi:hypothetical protein